MKLKALIVFILLPGYLFAQKFEIGLGGGAGTNTAPTANMPYKCDIYTVNYAANAKVLMNIVNNLQVGIEGSIVPLQGKTTHSYYNVNTHVSIDGNDNKKLVYSRTTPAVMAVANYKINLTNASYFYGGINIGYAETQIDHNMHSDETYLTPEGGHGYVTGLQIGYNYYFTDHFAIDLQAAARYYQFFYSAHIPSGPNGLDEEHLHYGIVDFPVTIGVRYRFLHKGGGGRGSRMMGDDNGSQRSRKSRSGKSKHMYW